MRRGGRRGGCWGVMDGRGWCDEGVSETVVVA